MKKTLFELLEQTAFVFVAELGDIVCRFVTGKNEFPKYYWLCLGVCLAYRILKNIDNLRKDVENKNEKNN